MLPGCSHQKAQTSPFPGSRGERSHVPDHKVSWLLERPVEYTTGSVLAAPTWADPQVGEGNFSPKSNEKDGPVEKKSQNGPYEVENVRSKNPAGRTGLAGQGLLGRWGPSHVADPFITRWKRGSEGNQVTHPVSGNNSLQFVAVQRKDCGEWAIPGGMVDPGATLPREFGEEAMNALQKSRMKRRKLEKQLHLLFSQDKFEVYKGYVDDPRSTDNAWVETQVVNYPEDMGKTAHHLLLVVMPQSEVGRCERYTQTVCQPLLIYPLRVAEKQGARWSEGL